MLSIEFEYNQGSTTIQAKETDLFKEVIERYYQKTMITKDTVYFITNGTIIEPERPVSSYMHENSATIQVLVNPVYLETETKVQVSNDIVCPECKQPCRISIDEYHIKLYECSNGHTVNDIKLDEFNKTQEIKVSEIKCDKCKIKNKGNSKELYYCTTCKDNVCLICKSKHDFNHNTIKYDQKNYICLDHKEPFVYYCKDCCKNICFTCDHQGHEIISLKQITPDKQKANEIIKEMKKQKEQLNNNIQAIITKLNEINKTIDTLYNINEKIITNYQHGNRNYQIYQNTNDIINNNKLIWKQINNINNNKNLKEQIYDIIQLSNNINSNTKTKEEIVKKERPKKPEENQPINKEEKVKIENQTEANEITMIYNIQKENKIKILGQTFVTNNVKKCKLKIGGKNKEITEYIEINNEQTTNKTITLKLIGLINVTDMSDMFSGCSSLNNLPDISKWNTQNVTNMRSMFDNCSSLNNLPDISKWNTQNVTDMSRMFYNCSSLNNLPDISKWNTTKLGSYSQMFDGCSKLNKIPKIK